MKKRGISLIVLIITIIIIIILAGAVILSLASNNLVEQANEARFKENVHTYQSELTLWLSGKYIETGGMVSISQINASTEQGTYQNLKIQDIILSLSDSKDGYTNDATKFEIQSGMLIFVGDNEQEKLWASEAGTTVGKEGANKPELVTGMTAKKFDSKTNSWITVEPTDSTWYDYHSKQWANAQTADGSMWVWIPRFVYKISTNAWHQTVNGIVEVQFSQATNDNWNQTRIGIVNNQNVANASQNSWTTHPAFTFGSTELTGIWVAKFEASSQEGYVGDITDNVSTKTIQIIPGVRPWTYIQVGNSFDACRAMETKAVYGWGTTGSGIDTHQMKNTEWGCVAYLTQSKYGLNGNSIAQNTATGYVTGGGSGNAYLTNVSQSTTGNITGVYDMSGGAFEYIAAYINNDSPSLTNYATSLVNAGAQYKDSYEKGEPEDSQNNYLLAKNYKGDALYETSFSGITRLTSWYTNESYMPRTTSPFFLRGGNYSTSIYAGIFSFSYNFGQADANCGFRPIICVASML